VYAPRKALNETTANCENFFDADSQFTNKKCVAKMLNEIKMLDN
jgi:hypothetical protein